jgi:hypothetical protein
MQSPKMVTMTCIFVVAFDLFLFSGCSGANNTTSSPFAQTSHTQTTPPGEASQPGTIPDTQVFVKYTSPQEGYELDVPKGWKQVVKSTKVCFLKDFDGIEIVLTQANTMPTVESVRTQQVIELEKTGNTIRDVQVQSDQLSGGSSILITYTSGPEAGDMAGTNKQFRLENNRYLFYKSGRLLSLTFWSPVGTNNMKQWAHMSNSFRWV